MPNESLSSLQDHRSDSSPYHTANTVKTINTFKNQETCRLNHRYAINDTQIPTTKMKDKYSRDNAASEDTQRHLQWSPIGILSSNNCCFFSTSGVLPTFPNAFSISISKLPF